MDAGSPSVSYLFVCRQSIQILHKIFLRFPEIQSLKDGIFFKRYSVGIMTSYLNESRGTEEAPTFESFLGVLMMLK